ncbi:MAG: hypothetical protein IJS15_00165 [Victivallales bacterium]|nr:hypothetical protein [Victivallales bacterium]
MDSKISHKPNTCALAAKLWSAMRPYASTTRARLGLFFFVVNFPFGYGGLFISSAIAASTHDARWLVVGTCCYALSWIMLGMSVLMLGSDTIAFLKGAGKRKFRAWRLARRCWKFRQSETPSKNKKKT